MHMHKRAAVGKVSKNMQLVHFELDSNHDHKRPPYTVTSTHRACDSIDGTNPLSAAAEAAAAAATAAAEGKVHRQSNETAIAEGGRRVSLGGRRLSSSLDGGSAPPEVRARLRKACAVQGYRLLSTRQDIGDVKERCTRTTGAGEMKNSLYRGNPSALLVACVKCFHRRFRTEEGAAPRRRTSRNSSAERTTERRYGSASDSAHHSTMASPPVQDMP